MKIIEVEESSLIIAGLVEMIMNKEMELYKSMEDYGMYKIKNTNIYICMVYNGSKLLNYNKIEIDYNTMVAEQLYKNNKLNTKNLIQLHELNIFM